MPQVSFIVPVYKIKEEYLRECIDSILNQTLTDIEILLIDDGSPDNCGEICDEYAHKDARVKVFHQSNQGVSAARNKGIAHATGEWITFVDADDWIELDMCQSLLGELDENDAGTDIIMFSGYNSYINREYAFTCKQNTNESYNKKEYTTSDQKLLLKIRAFGYYKNEKTNIPCYSIAATWCKLYHANFIKITDLKYDINLKYAEDTLFALKSIDLANKIIYLHKMLYHYRIRKSGTMRSYSIEFDKHIYETIKTYHFYINKSVKYAILMECYNYMVFKFAISVILKQYYNKQNRIPYIKKRKKSQSLLRSNTYIGPLNNVKLCAKNDIFKYILIKLNMFMFMSIITELKKRFSNLHAYD